ncbi:outer membrane beta-barrel protein [bacterium AH-315-M05]|nr:outer membrane beta-barrel protein [bacterium AH-315-M05]
MVNKNDEIKEIFRSSFEDFEADVNERVWENIEEALHPKSKRRFIWWQWAAAASIIVGISFYALWTTPDENNSLTEITKTNVSGTNNIVITEPDNITSQKEQQEIEKVTSPQNDDVTEKITEQVAYSEKMENVNKSINVGKEQITRQADDNINYSLDITTGSNIDNADISQILTSQVNETANHLVHRSDSNITAETHMAISETVADTASAFSLATPVNPNINNLVSHKEPAIVEEPEVNQKSSSTENNWIVAANIHSIGGSNALPEAGEKFGDQSSLSSSSTSTTTNMILFSSSQPAFGEITYAPPLITSITVNYQLNKRWSIETGLSYTVLLSNRETPLVNQEQTKLNTNLQYIGIPIFINFNIVSGKKITLFSSLGIMAEKGLKAKYTYIQIVNGKTTSETTESYPLQGMVISAPFGLGLDYRINNLLSFYLQPGTSVYIIGDGNPYNVRNIRLFWPNVQTGIRLHL